MSNTLRTLDKTLYTATVTAIGGRDGKVTSDDKTLELALAMPKGLGGPGGPGSNPEQLFAAGYSACFASALGHVARAQKIETGPVEVTAKVSIGPTHGVFGLAATLTVHIPNLPREQTESLVKAAHEVCPYSNATRGNIVVDLAIA